MIDKEQVGRDIIVRGEVVAQEEVVGILSHAIRVVIAKVPGYGIGEIRESTSHGAFPGTGEVGLQGTSARIRTTDDVGVVGPSC